MSEFEPTSHEEVIIAGTSASSGTIMGIAYIHQNAQPVVNGEQNTEVFEQLKCFRLARRSLHNKWQEMRNKEGAKESREILRAQLAIIGDPDLSQQIEHYIQNEGQTSQQAIEKAFSNYISLLADAEHTNMDDRLVDLTDIRDRLIEAAGSQSTTEPKIRGEIAVAKEFSPREIIQLTQQQVKGFVMEKGGNTSHAAIIARSIGVPAIVGAKEITNYLKEGEIVCLNGQEGSVILHPSKETRQQIERLGSTMLATLEEQKAIGQQASETTNGSPFTLLANVEFPEELSHVKRFGAEGIGLLRTESMCLDQHGFGTVEAQQELYNTYLDKTGDQPVTIRLFDVGGDKFQTSGSTESNPYLGWRGVRMLLDERDVLRNQLKAILTVAGAHPGRVKLLIPTVSQTQEVREVKKEIEAVQDKLEAEGTTTDRKLLVGMMVEIPNAVIHAYKFAHIVDFFSLGTNDLTQYLLAVDRGNALISSLYNQRHPVVWKMLHRVVKAAESEQIEIEICGELASDPVAAACLMGLGMDTLSMSPANIPGVKQMLRAHNMGEMKELAAQTLACDELDDVEQLFDKWEQKYTH